MAQYIKDSDAPTYDNSPQFRLVLINEVDEEVNHQGNSYYFVLHCRLAQNLTIRKSIWYRTDVETIDGKEYPKSTWKMKKVFEKAGVEPREVVERDGDTHRLYAEADLKDATIKALVYTNPETEFLEIFDFVHKDANDAEEKTLMNRFNKFYTNKFKQPISIDTKDAVRIVKKKTETPPTETPSAPVKKKVKF
jgi:hypothetical protein